MGLTLRTLRPQTVWLTPALAAGLLGAYRITTPELWRDEISSWSAAGRPLAKLFAILGNVDASNGAYYVVLHLWTAVFGESVLALRLLSALAMAGAAAFTALGARRWYGSAPAGLAAGLLLAAVPAVSAYAQEARSYALVTCAVAAATWCLLRALERPSFARWGWYGACTTLAGALHLVSLSALAGQAVLVLLVTGLKGWRTALQWAVTAVVAGLPLLPLVLVGQRQTGRQLVWIPTPTAHALRGFGPFLFASVNVWHAFEVLTLLALLLVHRRALGPLAMAVLPVLAVWVVSQGETSYFLDRYLLFTVPAWAVLAAGFLATRRGPNTALRVLLAVAAGVSVLLLGLPEQRLLRGVTAHSESDFRGAAELVAAGYRPGDGIVALAGWDAWRMIGPGVDYYLPPGVRPRPFLIAETAVQADDLFPVSCPAPAACIGSEPRTWVVTIGPSEDPFAQLPADQTAALRAVFTPAETRHVRMLTVSLLRRTHP
ncbi:glycosyltransferase family 39 protein [Kitasatospora sp. NPDC002227]|uniref:glycosyltransferase family 39 protein n=1 Tax=Kitasatospora sp. NPDC002227 TaxID=3154773 RepID=UPI00333365D6